MRKFITSAILVLTILASSITAAANSSTQSIGIGTYNAGIIDENGDLYIWGRNEYGEFGNGAASNTGKFFDFSKTEEDVSSVVFGYYNGVAILKNDGTLWSAGKNDYGQIGNGTTQHSSTFVKIDENVTKIGAGFGYYTYLKSDNTLWGVGNASDRQLLHKPDGSIHIKSPIKLMDNVKDFSSYGRNTAVINFNDELLMFGANVFGQLGIGNTENSHDMELPVTVLYNVRSVSVGNDYVLAVTKDNSLYAWGKNDYGQLFTGTTSSDKDYTPILAPIKVCDNVSKSAAGNHNSVYITTDGELYFAGHNLNNESGHKTDLSGIVTPIKIADNVKDAAIHDFLIYSTNDDTVFTAGNNINDIGHVAYGFKEFPHKILPESVIDTSFKNVITLQIGSNIMTVNGVEQTLVMPAQTINNRTMVPLRAIFEALGATVQWDNTTRSVTSMRGNTTVTMAIDSFEVVVDSISKPLDVAPALIGGNTMVPARAVAESFGCSVSWDGATQTVTITE